VVLGLDTCVHHHIQTIEET